MVSSPLYLMTRPHNCAYTHACFGVYPVTLELDLLFIYLHVVDRDRVLYVLQT